MLKAILADDEPFIRQGLKKLIDWGKCGYEVIAEAGDGLEAFEFIKKFQPDLVIADIKMPGMDGIELLEKVRGIFGDKIKFVILSGYYEFEYAKRAIRGKAAEYILKPVNKEEFSGVLEKIRLECDALEEQKKMQIQKEKFLDMQKLKNILIGKCSAEDLEDAKKFLSYSPSMRYISFELDDNDEKFGNMPPEKRVEVQKECFELLSRYLGGFEKNVLFGLEQESNIYDVGFVYTNDMAQRANLSEQEYINKIYNFLKEKLCCGIEIYIGQMVCKIEELSESRRSVSVARAFHKFSESEAPISYYDEVAYKKSRGFGIEKNLIQKLIECVKNNCPEEIESCIDRIYDEFKENLPEPQFIQTSIYYLLYRLAELAKEFDKEADQQEAMRYISQEAFDKIAARGSAVHFKKFVLEYAAYLEQLKKSVSGGVLPKIENYIKENYNKNLTLKSLGKQFFINEVYLGQLFKKEFGVSFKDYLTSMRIAHAEKLLAQTDVKVYKIAEEVGFSNPDYFISKFVQVKGVTPYQYRLKYKKDCSQKL